MCEKKDIDAVLKQLQQCQDHDEKRRLLDQFVNCETCEEKNSALGEEETQCRCEVYRQNEFLNTIEYVLQSRLLEK